MANRSIEHRSVVDRPFDDVCKIVDAHTEAILQAATATAARRVDDLVHADPEPLPGFDSREPVTIFLVDPDHNSEYQAWIDFRWTADPNKRLLANTRARLELRPHPDRPGKTELTLRAHYEPSPDSHQGRRLVNRSRRIVTAALGQFLQEATDYIDHNTTAADQPPPANRRSSAASMPASPARVDPTEPTRISSAQHRSEGAQGSLRAHPSEWFTMRRFHRILFVALGTRRATPAALDDAVALADRNDASLTVLGIVSAPPARQRGLRLPGWDDEVADVLAAELTSRLEAWIEPFSGNDTSVQVSVGNPPVDIVRHLIANDHDLLIVADDGTGESAAIIRRLLRLSPAPVWVLRPGHRGGRVLAAIDPDDDRDLNRLILQLAQSQAQLRDGEVHITHAWELHGESILAGSDYLPVPGPLLAQLAEQTEATHDHAFRQTIEQAGIGPHHEHLVNGTPVQAIVGLINLYRIDLLVMGSIGRAGLEGIFIGNTAEQLFTKVSCSVLVLKPPGFRSPISTDTVTS